MREDTRKKLEERLDLINGEIAIKEDKVYKWRAVWVTGLIGMGVGCLSLHDGRIIAGAIISTGGLLFKAINNMYLSNFKVEKGVLEYGLAHPENVIEYDFDKRDNNYKGGKHFKK